MGQIDASEPRQPLRLWPALIAAVLLCLLRFVLPVIVPDLFIVGFLGAVVCALAILIWWVFFSRAAWTERVGAMVLIVIAFLVTKPLLHRSIATGMMGMMYPMYALPPVLAPLFVAWAVLTRELSDGIRRATMVVTIFLACAMWMLFRTDGIIGSSAQLTWRWTKSAEERLLAKAEEPAAAPVIAPVTPKAGAEVPVAKPAAPAAPSESKLDAKGNTSSTSPPPSTPPPRRAREAEWPGFRGPNRDGSIDRVRINTDWTTSPPVQLWRRQIGPGWSSFAVTAMCSTHRSSVANTRSLLPIV